MSAPEPLSNALARITPLGRGVLVGLACAILGLSLRLWPEWRHNPDLSHGMLMPLLFLLLLRESRIGTPRFVRETIFQRLGCIVLLIGALLALVAAGLYAAALDWSHALVSLMLTTSVVLMLGAALLAFAGESVQLVPCNWSALVAIGGWLLAAPIPPGTYNRITLNLQLWVSENVLETLHVFGIAAIRHGNIIELARATVGVEEACSGIRSLVSCIFAGLFFSATLVRRPWARAAIVGLAPLLALVMNFLRSLTLTLLANHGIDISGAWHDATGFAVLGITAALLGVLAVLLERGDVAATPAPPESPLPVPARTPGLQRALALGLTGATALVVVFVLNTRPSPRRDTAVPDLFALLPQAAAGWLVRSTNLYEFSGTLQTNDLAQRSYINPTRATPTEIIIYVAYWRAGQAPVSLVASHTPDACWPGSGWVRVNSNVTRVPLKLEERTLPPAEYRVFVADEKPEHVWFWHLYDGRPISYRDPYSPAELLRIAWRFGFRHDGDQLFVRVSSNRPWSEISREPLIDQFFARMRALGL